MHHPGVEYTRTLPYPLSGIREPFDPYLMAHLDAIEFHDEEFFVNRKRGTRIAEMINGEYEWHVQTPMDDLLRLDLDMLERNGLRVVQPGLETGPRRILELIKNRKHLTTFIELTRNLPELVLSRRTIS